MIFIYRPQAWLPLQERRTLRPRVIIITIIMVPMRDHRYPLRDQQHRGHIIFHRYVHVSTVRAVDKERPVWCIQLTPRQQLPPPQLLRQSWTQVPIRRIIMLIHTTGEWHQNTKNIRWCDTRRQQHWMFTKAYPNKTVIPYRVNLSEHFASSLAVDCATRHCWHE